jgi:hypothetical protein
MMRSTFTRVPVLSSLLCAALLTASSVNLPQALSRAEHVRGTVVSIDAADVQRGARAVVFAHRDAGGTLIIDRVIVGKNGVVPPM